MKRFHIPLMALIMLLIAALLPTAAGAARPSAEAAISEMAAAMKKHPSLDITFTVWSGGNSSSGSMTLAGQRFTLSTPEMKVWFDGKTQWAYAVDAAEVNITEPTGAELAQTNPLSMLGALSKNCKLRRLKSTTTGTERIEIIPNRPTSDFASAILTINASTSLPKELSVKDSRGNTVRVVITGIKAGKTKPMSFFRFNPSAYPSVEVVDLR